MITGAVDTRNFMGALLIMRQFSNTEPSQMLHRAIAFVVKDAKENTPFVEMATIDTQLQVQSVPVLSTRGARKGLPLRSGKKSVTVTEGGLATKIVLARLQPYWARPSYNILTDNRYALDKATFSPGAGVAGFWAKVEEVARRMASSRHSATHFFQISWNPLLRLLAALVPASYQGAVMTWAGSGGEDPDLAKVVPAQPGQAVVRCEIQNRIGMDEQYPTIAAIRNMEAHRLLTPVLQTAIDRNFQSMMQMMGRKGWLDQAPKLVALGVLVN